jgi:SAM-dependent methyltransferase
MESGKAPALLRFLVDDPGLFEMVRAITGCRRIGGFDGHLYRMMPGPEDQDWGHNHQHNRLVAMCINLSPTPYSGGILEIRDRDSREVLQSVANTGPGDALLFSIAPPLEHRVTAVEGDLPRTVYEGWFTAGADPVYRRLGRRIKHGYAFLEEWREHLVIERRFDVPPEVSRRGAAKDVGLSMDIWTDLWTENRVRYVPSPWGILGRILRPGEVSPDDVFIDLGCGAGRVLLEAADGYGFKRVIGVDFVTRMAEMAREVIARNRGRLRCSQVEVVNMDLVDYEIPDDVTVAYVYDAFRGPVLDAVLEKLIASVDRNPRQLRLIYYAPREAWRVESTGRARLVRYGRRAVRRWRRAEYIAMYEIQPVGATETPGR